MTVENEAIIAPPRRHLRINRRHLALLVVLTLAAFLRFWQLDSLPPGLYHDEAYNGLDALSLNQGETFPIYYEGWELYAEEAHAGLPVQETRIPIFFEGNYGREPLHIYLMALSIRIFGPTPFAVRAVPAAAGVLAVWATYLAAGVLLPERKPKSTAEAQSSLADLDRFIPLLAAFVMAVFYPAVTFSRFGVRAMLFVPVGAMTVYCFWRGVAEVQERQRREVEEISQLTSSPIPLGTFAPRWFLLAGFFLGLGLYTYAAARLMPFLFVAFVLLWLIWDRQALRQQWGNLAVMVLSALIVAAPLLLFFLRYPYFLVFRSRYVANRGAGTYPGQPWLTWFYNLGRVIRGLLWQGETNLRHNLPGRPFLDPLQILFAAAGLGNMVQYVRQGRRLSLRHLFLIMWLLIMLVPSILSGDAPHFGRMIGAAPPLAILIGMGGAWILQQVVRFQLDLSGQDEAHERPLLLGIVMSMIMLLFLLSALLTTWDYFQLYADQPELDEAFYVSDWELGQYAAELPEESTVYLSPTQEQMATIYFVLGGQRERLRSYFSPEGLIPAGHIARTTVYLLRPPATETLPRLESFFPAGSVLTVDDDFVPFQVPGRVPRILPRKSANLSWGGAIGLLGWSTIEESDHLLVTLYWQSEVNVARNYTAYVHLLDEDGELRSQLDRPPEGYPTSDWQPGEIIIDTYAVPLPADLPAGEYMLQSGFYHLPSDERLGEPAVFGTVELRP